MPVQLDIPLAEAELVIVDIETTGITPPIAKITEIAAVKIRGGEIDLELAQLVDPGCPIPPHITQMTGISNTLVAGQPSVGAVWPYFRSFIGDAVLVAHNASFDLGFLDHTSFELTGEPLPNPELCTVKLSRKAWPWMERHNLDTVAGNLGLTFADRHRALSDARVTAQVLLEAIPLLATHGIHTLGEALRKQRSARCHQRLSLLAG
jgi:DNA polymerase III epsilon subunit family exonuclease